MENQKLLQGSDEAFEYWLREQPKHAEVGFSFFAGRCPLARYAKEKTGLQWYICGDNSWIHHKASDPGEPKMHRIAPWAALFAQRIDSISTITRPGPVSREQALAVINSVRVDLERQ